MLCYIIHVSCYIKLLVAAVCCLLLVGGGERCSQIVNIPKTHQSIHMIYEIDNEIIIVTLSLQ